MTLAFEESALAEMDAASTMGLRERNKLSKFNRILAAGKALFNERGYEGTTTQAVAKAAGIGVGTLFSYVSSKEDLLIIVFMDDLQNVVQNALNKIPQDAILLERILTFYSGLLQYHINNFDLSKILMREVVNVKNKSARANVIKLMSAINNCVVSLVKYEQDNNSYCTSINQNLLADNCFAIYYDVLQRTVNEGESLAGVGDRLRDRLKLQLEPYYMH